MLDDQKYWLRQTAARPLFPDLAWNLPEQPTGELVILGGSSAGFAVPVRIAESTCENGKFARVRLALPEGLAKNFPNSATSARNHPQKTAFLPKNAEKSPQSTQKSPPITPTFIFLPATASGSFRRSAELERLTADALLIAGDFSKNAETAVAVRGLAERFAGPLVLTRDAVDLLAPEATTLLTRPNLTLVLSLVQLQKLLRALYYPRPFTLTAPLAQIAETLHKFTLSYTAVLLTLAGEQILTAGAGTVVSTPLAATAYAPLSLWDGELAAKVLTYQFFNPGHLLEGATAAVLA